MLRLFVEINLYFQSRKSVIQNNQFQGISEKEPFQYFRFDFVFYFQCEMLSVECKKYHSKPTCISNSISNVSGFQGNRKAEWWFSSQQIWSLTIVCVCLLKFTSSKDVQIIVITLNKKMQIPLALPYSIPDLDENKLLLFDDFQNTI